MVFITLQPMFSSDSVQIGSLTRTPAENPTWHHPLMYFNHYFLKIHFGAVDTWQLESQKRILKLDFHFLHILDILDGFHLLVVYLFTLVPLLWWKQKKTNLLL